MKKKISRLALCALLFGLGPALSGSRADLHDSLRGATRSSTDHYAKFFQGMLEIWFLLPPAQL